MADAPAPIPIGEADGDRGPVTSPLHVKKPGVVRVWMDGCFDLMHFGHANAMRQARALGDELYVGVHSDAEVEHNKGPTIMKEQERYAAVRGCKWVTHVVEDAPYTTQVDVLRAYNCDYCVHGDDLSVGADGTDTYKHVKEAGMFRVIRRTEGVSTTDIVGRMLLVTRGHHHSPGADGDERLASAARAHSEASPSAAPAASLSKFVATTRKVALFSNGKPPPAGARVVYVDGAFDLFHVGHIEMLRLAKALGDFLVVGLHDDATVNRTKGSNFPIMNVHERTLSALACRYVDEVVIDVPYVITDDFLASLEIQVVAFGSVRDAPASPTARAGEPDAYAVPRARGMLRAIASPSALTAQGVIERVVRNRAEFEERNRVKAAKDAVLQKECRADPNRVAEK